MTTRSSDNQPIDDLVADCCEQLFADYGLNVVPRSRHEFPATEKLAMCGVMGFAGKQMRGALVLATTREPLEQTNHGNQQSQRDWICELANQLVGRVKNQLLLRNVEILLGLPTALSGDNLCPVPTGLRAPQLFASLGGFVCVWIDYELAAGFQLPTGPVAGAEAPLPEGQALFF